MVVEVDRRKVGRATKHQLDQGPRCIELMNGGREEGKRGRSSVDETERSWLKTSAAACIPELRIAFVVSYS